MIACPETLSFNKAGWSWRLRDSSLLEPWFDEYLAGNTEGMQAVNSGKDIIRALSYNRNLLIRSYHPKRTIAKLKSRMTPKAKDEFEASQLLEDMNIPCLECLGWGRRGPDSICVFNELPNSMSAREFWFSGLASDAQDLRKGYLIELARFIARLFAAGLHHPDLRLARLIVSGDPFSFLVAEPNGFSRPQTLETPAKLAMLRMIGELRGEINIGEAAAIIMYTSFEQDGGKAAELWKGIIRHETDAIEASWPKRRSQILKADPRYCAVAPNGFIVRCCIDGVPALSPEDLDPAGLVRFDRLDFSGKPNEALRLWLLSCKLMLHRIRHRAPMIMETDSNGRPIALHFERHDGIVAGSQLSIDEFIDRCLMAGIKRGELDSNIDIFDSRLEIADIRKLSLEV